MPRKNGKGKASQANKIKRLEQTVRQLVKSESADKGILDDERNVSVTSSTSFLHTCFLTAAGTGLENRDGLSIVARSVEIGGLMVREDHTNKIRLLAVQFESYADASIDNVLQYPNGDATYLDRGIYSPYKVGGDCKFRVLLDKVIECDTTKETKKFRYSIKAKDLKGDSIMKYTQELAQVPQSNPIVLYACSDSYYLSAAHPGLRMYIRQRFDK